MVRVKPGYSPSLKLKKVPVKKKSSGGSSRIIGWSQGKPPTKEQVKRSSSSGRARQKAAYEARMKSIEEAAAAKSAENKRIAGEAAQKAAREAATKIQEQKQIQAQNLENQNIQERIFLEQRRRPTSQELQKQPYGQRIKAFGPVTATTELVGEAAVGGYTQRKQVKEQVRKLLGLKRTPSPLEVYETIKYGAKKAKGLRELREQAKKGAIQTVGTIAPFIGPQAPALMFTSAVEQVTTKGGQQRIAEQQIFLEGEGLAPELAYIPPLVEGAVGGAGIGRQISSAAQKAGLKKATTAGIATVEKTDDITKINFITQTQAGKKGVTSVGQQLVRQAPKPLPKKVKLAAGKSVVIEPTKKGAVVRERIGVGVSGDIGKVGKVEDFMSLSFGDDLARVDRARIFREIGEGSLARTVSKTTRLQKVSKDGGIMFKTTKPKQVSSQIQIDDMLSSVTPTKRAEVFKFEGVRRDTKLKKPDTELFVEVLQSFDDRGSGLRTVQKLSKPEQKVVGELISSTARADLIASVTPKKPIKVVPIKPKTTPTVQPIEAVVEDLVPQVYFQPEKLVRRPQRKEVIVEAVPRVDQRKTQRTRTTRKPGQPQRDIQLQPQLIEQTTTQTQEMQLKQRQITPQVVTPQGIFPGIGLTPVTPGIPRLPFDLPDRRKRPIRVPQRAKARPRSSLYKSQLTGFEAALGLTARKVRAGTFTGFEVTRGVRAGRSRYSNAASVVMDAFAPEPRRPVKRRPAAKKKVAKKSSKKKKKRTDWTSALY